MWYKSFGWQENPFSIKTNTNLIGVNERKKELINYILSGDICFLNGPTGVGKSSMLRLVRKELKRHKVIYIDAAGVDDNFSITKHLQKFTPIWHKIAGKRFPPNSVILLDESQECDEELVKALKFNDEDVIIEEIDGPGTPEPPEPPEPLEQTQQPPSELREVFEGKKVMITEPPSSQVGE